MASSYSTDLKLELMVTGENSGTWGDKTNTNLNLLQQAIAGYQDVSIAGGAQTTALVMTDATLSNARNAVIKFSGTITGNQIVTIPDSIEKTYILYNGTTGAFTVQFKTVSGTGPTFSTTDKGFKYVYSNGTDVIDVPLGVPGGSTTQVQFNSSGSFGGSANLTWDGTNFNIGATGALRLQDTTGGEYVGLKAPGTVASSYTLTLPTATGTANQVLTTDGSGNLSFATVSGGAAWQAVVTSSLSVTAKAGYFVNTSSAAITATLPASPTLGDFISFVDYSGTFDTNNFTVARNGNKIQGDASDLTVATERAGFTLVYVDATQGWLLQNN
jgi:trimeric autotransporter adhesin